MNRGRRRERTFLDDADFINLLRATSEMFHMGLTANGLMSKHYHLLVHTPEGNLTRCMRRLGGPLHTTFQSVR